MDPARAAEILKKLPEGHDLLTGQPSPPESPCQLVTAKPPGKDGQPDAIRAPYPRHSRDLLIKWKDSIKKVIGLNRPTAACMDI